MRRAIKSSALSLWKALPLLLGTMLLISLLTALVPTSVYADLFNRNDLFDSLFGALVGSVLVGNPVVSYILGGELLAQGVGLVAVTAFLVAWTTVGVAQFPAEAAILGRRFAYLRNVSAFVMALVVALVTVAIMTLIV